MHPRTVERWRARFVRHGWFMGAVAAQYPTEPVHVIWNCLNIHFDGTESAGPSILRARPSTRLIFDGPKVLSHTSHAA